MHCIILFPGPEGRLPTARQLRRAGFRVSAAVGPPAEALEQGRGCGAALPMPREAACLEAGKAAYLETGETACLAAGIALAAEEAEEYPRAPR
mgnify:CR=1 FL=1